MVKLSIITCTFNSSEFIQDCLKSVSNQSFSDVEHVIQDGCSSDDTIKLIHDVDHDIVKVFQEPDHGIYDAMNKAINHSKGEIIGILHSDDLFSSDSILQEIMIKFSDPSVNVVYGDIVFFDGRADEKKIKRYWRAGEFHRKKLKFGWMPPHPTMFIRKSFLLEAGVYNTDYSIAGDYEAFLRWSKREDFKCLYFPAVVTEMRLGGVSTRLNSFWAKSVEDYRAIRENNIGSIFTLVYKKLAKIPQVFFRGTK